MPFALWWWLHGCIELPEEVPRDCPERSAWYPDEDQDGLGESDRIYIGCEGPPGWVRTLDTSDTGLTVASTADTGVTRGTTADTGR